MWLSPVRQLGPQPLVAKDSYVTHLRVVIAEDHPQMALHLRALLASEYDVRIVSDGRALMVAVDLETPDIIISDIKMPGLNGLAAAPNIRAKHPEVPFIFVSVQDDPAVIRKALAEGARGYVIKSDAGDELAGAVEAVLCGGRYLSSSARAALGSGPV
jgi:DNA-binding NarL/FixJ family response regulator